MKKLSIIAVSAIAIFMSNQAFASSEIGLLGQALSSERNVIEITSSDFDFTSIHEVDVNRARVSRARKGVRARRSKTIR